MARTVFVGNIDRVVERDQLREFFGNLCGERTAHIIVPVQSSGQLQAALAWAEGFGAMSGTLQHQRRTCPPPRISPCAVFMRTCYLATLALELCYLCAVPVLRPH